MLKEWSKLLSGTDIRGVAVKTKESEIDLTNEKVDRIARAFVKFINKENKENFTIAVGRDSRISGERIEGAIIASLVNAGANVVSVGLCSTPAMFMIIKDEKQNVNASIQITASHHPFDKNGLKFFSNNGGLEHEDVEQILKLAEADEKMPVSKKGIITKYNYLEDYANDLVKFFLKNTKGDKPLKDLKIIVDAGNGVGGFYAEKVLKVLGADITGSQFLEPDGNFPNHIPNPENKDAMKSITNAVITNKADYGIIFDTDVDRAGMVEGNGEEINRNKLIALISAILLEEKAGGTIVTDSVTSNGLKEFIVAKGGVHHRFKRGYKNVINESIRLNNEGVYSPLAIETSGHAALKENYFLDDGAYLVTRILIKIANLKAENKTIDYLLSGLKEPVEEAEIRLTFETEDFKEYGNNIIADLFKIVEEDKNVKLEDSIYEGIRIVFDEGFILVRMSVHDPIMPINIESDINGGNKTMAMWLYDKLKGYDKLNSDNLLKFIK